MTECERAWIQYRDSRDVREGLDEVVLIYCSGTFLGNWQGGGETVVGINKDEHW